MKMVTQLFTDAGRTWREAARHNSKGKLIYEALQQEMKGPLGAVMRKMIQQNAAYISQIPSKIAEEMTNHVMERTLAGTRPGDIAKDLKAQFPHMSDVKANLIARTESAKTHTALIEARCEIRGISWYQWHTSEDERVRDSHRLMDKVLVPWGHAPDPEELFIQSGKHTHNGHKPQKPYGSYQAGSTFNCRCFPSPVISLDYVEWPARVYVGGEIRNMTRGQFERLMPAGGAHQKAI